jgi:signal transduction histidine kinase
MVLRYSIRWRLPLSYAAIALLATLALGSVLLLALRGHYLRVERDYLQSNAQAIGFSLGQLLEGDPSPEVLQSQLDSLAFLSNTHVRLFDAGEELVASSDPQSRVAIALAGARLEETLEAVGRVIALIQSGEVPTATLPTEDGALIWIPTDPSRSLPLPEEGRRRIFTLPMEGEARQARAEAGQALAESGGTRSSQVARVPILGSGDQLLGYVELSQGPAYAREILEDVAWGLGIAAAVAVALAAVVGWLISRRITAPLLALTEVTGSMASGDLTARADVARRDELGTLAHSFNQMADRVEGIVITLRRFVSDAAHEIHTPLTALHTNLELAQKDEHVAQAQTQVERLEALTEGLLDLSRLESGTQRESLAPVPLVPLVQEVSERYASRAEQARLTFELSVPDRPVTVQGDEEQLRRALTNLLDNAIKFTPEGGSVFLGLRQEGDFSILWVEDTGIGIHSADLPHLFERFHRGRNAAAFPGSGLGLAIVKAVVEHHEGQVQAQRIEQGARFTIRIPTLGDRLLAPPP